MLNVMLVKILFVHMGDMSDRLTISTNIHTEIELYVAGYVYETFSSSLIFRLIDLNFLFLFKIGDINISNLRQQILFTLNDILTTVLFSLHSMLLR